MKSNKKIYDPEPTIMQKRAIDNVLSGKHKTMKSAMLAAGYSKASATVPKQMLKDKPGVQKYLAQLDEEAKKNGGKGLKSKVISVYYDGLNATKLVGRGAIEHPDYAVRKMYADKFSEFFKWDNNNSPVINSKKTQINFFSIPKEEQEKFNENFAKFMRNKVINK